VTPLAIDGRRRDAFAAGSTRPNERPGGASDGGTRGSAEAADSAEAVAPAGAASAETTTRAAAPDGPPMPPLAAAPPTPPIPALPEAPPDALGGSRSVRPPHAANESVRTPIPNATAARLLGERRVELENIWLYLSRQQKGGRKRRCTLAAVARAAMPI
jgi:hypothetical protein